MSKQQEDQYHIPDTDYDDFLEQMDGQEDPPKQPQVPVDKPQQG